jgi:hypothetical protein
MPSRARHVLAERIIEVVMRFRSVLALALLGFTFTGCAATEPPRVGSMLATRDVDQACAPLGTAYTRTTLYFGLTRPTGTVSEAEWQAFLRNDVTPRFPDGLTVLEGDGQYRRTDGTIGRERSKVVVILHDEKPTTREALGTVVGRYKEAFAQESVLWESARVCAAF